MTKKLFSKKIFALVIMSAVSVYAWGQEPEERDLDRRVDVSREYMPDMDRASKLTIQPIMNDTVSLRPELEYTVAPSPWITGFGVAAINPVRVDAASFEQLLPFYMKAGFGIPSRSILDIYGTTTSTGGGYAGGYINHRGRWSKLRNDVGLKERALEGNNSVGIFGRTYIGRRMALAAEIGYDYDIYSRYGHIDPAYTRKSELISYSVPRAAFTIGNDFTDMSFFNFAVGAEGYMLKDRQDAKETGVKISVALGKRFGIHQLMLEGSYEGVFGSKARDEYDLNLLSIKPSYRIKGEILDIGASVEFAYSNPANYGSKTFFLPSASLEVDLDGAFRPFASLNSTTVSNSYRSLTSRNPYIMTRNDGDPFIHPSRDYKLLGGIRGDISSNFSYEVRVGGGMVKDIMYTAYHSFDGYYSGYFLPFVGKKLNYFTAGASLSGRISHSFSAGLEADYYNYSPKNDEVEYAVGMPEFEGNIFLKYNWKDKFLIKLSADLKGTRHFYHIRVEPPSHRPDDVPSPSGPMAIYHNYDKAKAVFDLGLEAEYKLNKNLGVWLAGDNLFNRKLYPYYHYRGFGISVTAGIKLMF